MFFVDHAIRGNDTIKLTAFVTNPKGESVPDANVMLTVYDPTDGTYAVDQTMTEIGNTGMYTWTNTTTSASSLGVYLAQSKVDLAGSDDPVAVTDFRLVL